MDTETDEYIKPAENEEGEWVITDGNDTVVSRFFTRRQADQALEDMGEPEGYEVDWDPNAF